MVEWPVLCAKSSERKDAAQGEVSRTKELVLAGYADSRKAGFVIASWEYAFAKIEIFSE